MKNLLEFLLIHLVNHPEDVHIDEEVRERETAYTLHVNQEDMGRVIGKNGSIINAIRSIAKVRAVKEGIRVTIILAEQEQAEPEAPATTAEVTQTPATETVEE